MIGYLIGFRIDTHLPALLFLRLDQGILIKLISKYLFFLINSIYHFHNIWLNSLIKLVKQLLRLVIYLVLNIESLARRQLR